MSPAPAAISTFSYDPFSAEAHEDPYPLYAILRDHHPVYRNPAHGFWTLSRFEDVQSALRDWKRFSSRGGVELDGSYGPGSFIDLDPPAHDRLRTLLRADFTPRRINALEGVVCDVTTRLLNRLIEQGGGDFATEFAAPLPVMVLADMMRLPDSDLPMLQRWATDIVWRDPGSAVIPPSAASAAEEANAYLVAALAERERGEDDDLLSVIARARGRGELTHEEAGSMAHLVFVAATETTNGFIGTSLELLARHPEQRAWLSEAADRLPAAIEELLRFEAPVQQLARTASEDVSLYDTTIPAGGRVLMLYGAANRDERRFPHPDRLLLNREPQRNLAFGEGIHHCLGAPLARLEARVALREVLARVPHYELAGPHVRLHTHTTRVLAHLPVAL